MKSKRLSQQSLAARVRECLTSQGIETPMLFGRWKNSEQHISTAVRTTLEHLGLDLSDDSLRETPKRVAKMYCHEVFWGLDYANFPKITDIENKMRYDEMISQRCTVMSMCEHHLVPFMGTAHVGYIPGTRVLGLSKMNRIVDFFSRRPQVQERLTAQIVAALSLILETADVACVIQAEHLCVKFRGVRDQESFTVTSKMSGRFLSVPELRSEFLALTRNHD